LEELQKNSKENQVIVLQQQNSRNHFKKQEAMEPYELSQET